MDNLKFVIPSKDMEDEIISYRNEFRDSRESIDGSAGLDKIDDFNMWLTALKLNSCESTLMDGYVPSSTYLVLRNCDNRLVGFVDIRHRLNDSLKRFGGHIGYSVRKSERRKGYAKKILCLALEECKKMNINRVLLTCNKENIASARTIIANGGILENEVIDDSTPESGIVIQKYWIYIDKSEGEKIKNEKYSRKLRKKKR